MAQLDFWYSIGSTYSYLTVMRIDGVGAASGVDVRWRPFNVRHVMIEQNNIPFKDKPVKTAYMWRDIERRAARYGLAPQVPATYPIAELVLANQVALLGMEQGWGPAFTQALYRRWFEQGQSAGDVDCMRAALAEVGAEADAVMTEAQTDRVVDALQAETEVAMALGVFGSPTFVVGREVFWGDDRLEDAVLWSKGGGA